MTRHLLPAGLAVVSLAGCSLAPAYAPPAVTVPAAWMEIAPWRLAQPSDDLPHGPWWRRFGDPLLDQLEARIERDNPDYAAALARYDQARADSAEAASALYPRVAVGAALSTNRQSADRPLRNPSQPSYYGSNQLDVAAAYEIDLWGRIRSEVAAGRAAAQASSADAAAIRLSLQAEVATDYLALRGLDCETGLLDETVRAYQAAFALTENRFNGKIASSEDVSRAQTQLETARAQVSDVASRRALLEHAIAALIGEPAGSFAIPVEEALPALPHIPPGAPSELLQRRPDIAAAERTVMAANARIGVARAAFYPALSIGLVGGAQSTELNLLSLPNSFWSIGPSVTLPVFNGGLLKAREAAAYASFQEAGATYRSAVLDAFREVEDRGAELHWLGAASADEDSAESAAQHTLEVAMTLYREGAVSYLDVVTAQTALLQTQQAALDLKTRRLVADVGLIRALGGGWEKPPGSEQAS